MQQCRPVFRIEEEFTCYTVQSMEIRNSSILWIQANSIYFQSRHLQKYNRHRVSLTVLSNMLGGVNSGSSVSNSVITSGPNVFASSISSNVANNSSTTAVVASTTNVLEKNLDFLFNLSLIEAKDEFDEVRSLASLFSLTFLPLFVVENVSNLFVCTE